MFSVALVYYFEFNLVVFQEYLHILNPVELQRFAKSLRNIQPRWIKVLYAQKAPTEIMTHRAGGAVPKWQSAMRSPHPPHLALH